MVGVDIYIHLDVDKDGDMTVWVSMEGEVSGR